MRKVTDKRASRKPRRWSPLIGGIKVYNKFSSGDPDTSKTAASWFGACIFLIVAATILRSFFL